MVEIPEEQQAGLAALYWRIYDSEAPDKMAALKKLAEDNGISEQELEAIAERHDPKLEQPGD